MDGVPGFPVTTADLVSPDEITAHLPNFTIQCAGVLELLHTHDDAPPDPSTAKVHATFVRDVRPGA